MVYRLVMCFCLFFFTASAQKMSSVEYIAKYKDLAISEMNQYGIPASITLAQGVLESGNGNSELARKAKNHFGIKCHSSWTGKKVYHDDDEAQECFRKYPTVSASYRDHSIFLQKARYANLFELSITDYRGWAKGLKKAGYATNPQYPERLINIIELHHLQQYDNPSDAAFMAKRFYYGTAYGWPYIIGESVIYRNEHKGVLLSGALAASLDNVNLLFGGAKLLHRKIGLGLELGVALDNEMDDFAWITQCGLSVSFILPYKEKVWVIKPAVLTSDVKTFTPTISLGLLR